MTTQSIDPGPIVANPCFEGEVETIPLGCSKPMGMKGPIQAICVKGHLCQQCTEIERLGNLATAQQVMINMLSGQNDELNEKLQAFYSVQFDIDLTDQELADIDSAFDEYYELDPDVNQDFPRSYE